MPPKSKPIVTRRKQKGGKGTWTDLGGIKYSIAGTHDQELRVMLDPGKSITAESGSMAYMGDLTIETNAGGIGKAIGRMFAGESIFQNQFVNKTQTAQGICLAGAFPGSIVKLDVSAPWKVSQGTYLAGHNVEVSAKFNWKNAITLGWGSDEGLVLPLVKPSSGNSSGTVWLACSGTPTEHVLDAGEVMYVDNENFLACEENVPYQVSRMNQGFKSLIFGGEGLSMKFVGPCTIWTQTRGIDSIVAEIAYRLPQGSSGNGDGFSINIGGARKKKSTASKKKT